jgi:hypothetical protein
MSEVGTKRREDLCKKFFCAVKTDNLDVTRYLAFPMSCKSWDCPSCRRKKAEDYRSRMNSIDDGRKLWFLTLTYFHNNSPLEAWRTYNVAWNRLRTHISKRYGSFDYIRVLESHKNSPYPHLHVILDAEMSHSFIGEAAVSAGFGYQIKYKPITADGCFAYIRKYLTKEWKNEEAWKLRKHCRCRIISFSRGLLSPARRKAGWTPVLVGSDFECCLDHIKIDYEWHTTARAQVQYQSIGEDFAEITVLWTDFEITPASADLGPWDKSD